MGKFRVSESFKVDFTSIDEEFKYSYTNLRYAKRHYAEFSQDAIMELSIRRMGVSKDRDIKVEAKYHNSPYYGINTTSIVFDSDGKYLSSTCECPYHSSYDPCGHVWILAKFLDENDYSLPYEYKDKNYGNVDEFVRELMLKEKIKDGRRRLELFYDKIIEEEIQSQKNISESASVSLVPEFFKKEEYSEYFTLKYRIGVDKMYIVKNIKDKLLIPIKYNEYVDYGKEFKTILSPDILDEASLKEVEFLKNNLENIEKNTILINEATIDDFFDLHKEDGGLDNLDFIEKDFKFSLKVNKVREYYELEILDEYSSLSNEEIDRLAFDELSSYKGVSTFSEYKIENKLRSIKSKFLDKEYISTNKRFYELNLNPPSSARLYYMDATKDEALFYRYIKYNEMYFTKDELSEIINIYKDRLSRIHISDDILAEFIGDKVSKPALYCDINEDMDLIINIKYKNDKANLYFKKMLRKLDLLDLKYQLEKLYKLDEYDIDETYVVKNHARVVDFIESILPNLNDDAEVFLSESIKNYSHVKTLNLSVGVKVRQNLLSLEFMSDDIDPKEFYDILARYRKKKRYYKMKSGQIIKIDRAQMEELNSFVLDMGIDDKELKKAKMTVPSYRRFRLGSENFLNVLTDEKFDKLFEKKPVKINKKYENILRDYQKDGVKFMLELRAMGLSGLLADDMGLGKTVQVIALLESIKKRNRPVLIVSPSSLILNWENEFHKFNSNLDIKTVHGNKEARKLTLASLDDEINDSVFITSYDYLKRDVDLYEDVVFDTVVIDEAQYIKNYKTKAARAVKKLNRNHSIALTGTPIENSLAEIWSVFDFLMPNYLFNYNKFNKNYEKAIVLEDDERVSKRLKKMIEPFILRRLKKDVLTELPEKVNETYYIELSEEERELYRANLYDINAKLHQGGNANKIEVLAMLTRLRQICIDAGLVYDKVYKESSKIRACMEIVEKAILNKQKILIFSSFTTVLDTIAEKCNEKSLDYFTLTGSTNKVKRKEYVDRFQNGEGDLFLISLKAGGTGLNLTEASVVLHIDPWWNISAQNQASDRAHRIGQKKNVQVINLIAKDTIEEKIQKMQEKKQELSDTFVENSEGSFARLDKDELMELFSMD